MERRCGLSFSRDTSMPGSDSSELRVSDQERERVAREIREHFAAGRLTDEELDHRLAAVYAARTQSELADLRSDLPQLPATRAEQRAELAERRAIFNAGSFSRAAGRWVRSCSAR